MSENTKTISLTQGHVALVDADDYETLVKLKWYASTNKNGNTYAMRDIVVDGIKKHFRMHRVVVNAPPELFVDHINHDGLDNRRANLRLCTKSENMKNRSGACRGASSAYLGVAWKKDVNLWQAGIRYNGKRHALGTFKDEIEAALAYDAAARQYHGPFANPNFPEEN